MHTLDFILQPRLDSRHSLAADRHFLHVVGRPSRRRHGVLRVYDFADEMVSLGRYHLAPPTVTSHVRLRRRFSGGRAIPCGDGFVCLSLVLPHRAGLLSDDPLALAPYQVMNRYVRGILEGCKLVNLSAFYPGRDFITVNRRVLALVSFEVDRDGAMLFEAIIANQREFATLPRLLDVADPRGVVKAEMLTGESTTSFERELGTRLDVGEVAELLRRGYEKHFDLECVPHALTALEHHAIEATAEHEFADDTWLLQRHPRPDLDRHATARVQLGLFEAHFALEQERFIKDIVFAGDFIANSSGIEQLERNLRLCPADWRAIDAVASEAFAQPENFILGVGRVHAIADTVCRGLG
jgi:lipoate-protein ligase A